MSTDLEILKKAAVRESGRRPSWQYYEVGASVGDVHRLLNAELIQVAVKADGERPVTLYKLTEKGKRVIAASTEEAASISEGAVMAAFEGIVGFEDIKENLARAIGMRRKINFLLEGPPACAKSLFLEAVRSVVPKSYPAFGSRTSAAGLSDILFEHQPEVLLMDECDKMRGECFSVLLGLMESGEIIETKSKKVRGIKLHTLVIGACNSSEKFAREFLSRFAWHIRFPPYKRDEFIDVCRGFLTRSEGCPLEIAELIGAEVYDKQLGDVRKARGVWQLMTEPTEEEVRRVIELQKKYSPEAVRVKKAASIRLF